MTEMSPKSTFVKFVAFDILKFNFRCTISYYIKFNKLSGSRSSKFI